MRPIDLLFWIPFAAVVAFIAWSWGRALFRAVFGRPRAGGRRRAGTSSAAGSAATGHDTSTSPAGGESSGDW